MAPANAKRPFFHPEEGALIRNRCALGGATDGLLADAAADLIFLLIERALLLAREVPPVLRRHIPLFLANLPVLAVQAAGLLARQVPFPDLLVDAAVLVAQPAVDFHSPRMRATLGLGGQGQGDGEARRQR